MEKKQLATEWLMEKLYEEMELHGNGNVLDDIFQEAKEMEKQNIFDGFYAGEEDSHIYQSSPTIYFNENFKQD